MDIYLSQAQKPLQKPTKRETKNNQKIVRQYDSKIRVGLKAPL